MRLPSPDIPLFLIGLALGPAFAQERPSTPAPAPAMPAQERTPVVSGFGMAATGEAIPEALRSAGPDTPCWVRLTAGRADLDDPTRLVAALDAARGRGLLVLVRLTDADWQPVEPWFARLQGLARAAGNRVDAWQFLGAGAPEWVEAREYSYLVKQARVAIRSGGSEAAIVSAPLPDDPGWIESIFAEDAGPYLDVLAASDPAALAAVVAARDRLHGRAPVWITDAPIAADRPGAFAVRDA
ncbi:MAG TPA: hypothetical protein VMQ62_02605, partial [Dongiaceae bacterium]|nr:hypothetical protein [Dongiaceae bacterium]